MAWSKDEIKALPAVRKEKDGNNTTYTTVKVGLGRHCNNVGMRETMSEMSLFASQSANQAGYVMKALFLSRHSSTDPDEIARIDTILKKYEPTKSQTFAYNCLNKKSPLRELTPYPYDLCDFPEFKGPRSTIFDSHSRAMLTNIREHFKNWHIYQKLAIDTEVITSFKLDRTKKADRKRLHRLSTILIQQINGTKPLGEMDERDSDTATSIVENHRAKLGIGNYSIILDKWTKYFRKMKMMRRYQNQSQMVCAMRSL